MRFLFIALTLLGCSTLATAQISDEDTRLFVSDSENYLPPLEFDGKQPLPFRLNIEHRNYSQGTQGLQSYRDYLAQERLRLSKGEGQWTPPPTPLIRSQEDRENDEFYDQTLFQLMYRFNFN